MSINNLTATAGRQLSGEDSDIHYDYLTLAKLHSSTRVADTSHDYSDSYFRNTERTEEQRTFEIIRQRVLDLEALTDIIPFVLSNDIPKAISELYSIEFDPSKEGLFWGISRVDSLCRLMATYAFRHNVSLNEGELAELIQRTQSSVTSVVNQMSPLFAVTSSPGEYPEVYSTSNPKFQAIVTAHNNRDFQGLMVEDLVKKYGFDFCFFYDCTFTLKRYGSFDVLDHVLSDLEAIKANPEEFQRVSTILSTGIKSAREAYKLATLERGNFVSVDLLTRSYLAIQGITLDSQPKFIDFFLNEQFTLIKDLALEAILKRLTEFSELDSQALDKLTYSQQKVILKQYSPLSLALVRFLDKDAFFELESQLYSDLGRNDAASALSILVKSASFNCVNHVSDELAELDEFKSLELTEKNLARFKGVLSNGIDQNMYLYGSIYRGIFTAFVRAPNVGLNYVNSLVSEYFPYEIQFLSNHEAQMTKFISFLEMFFLGGTLPLAEINTLYPIFNSLIHTDSRYAQINKMADSFIYRLFQTFGEAKCSLPSAIKE